MKLLAIYNVWDAWELLEGSIRQIREHVDCVLVVFQVESNYGERDDSCQEAVNDLYYKNLVDATRIYSPILVTNAASAETRKRQLGIQYARENGFTHFLHMDCDEYYDPDEFAQAKAFLDYESIDGSVCSIQTYYKRPEWKFSELDSYFVPFIHRVKPNTTTGIHNNYRPFYVDPTRRIGPVKNVLAVNPGMCIMHHFSYIRTDIEKKLRNSTARKNLNIPAILKEYREAEPGKVIQHYDKRGLHLVETENRFGIKIRGDEKEGKEAAADVGN